MNFADLTYEEIRDLVPETAAVFIPLGCTEQQGPHLPVDFDSWMIDRICQDVAERFQTQSRRKILVMPTLPFGPTPEHTGFKSGFVNLRQSTHEAIVEDLLDSLATQGFRLLLLWRGCGQHDLEKVVEAFNTSHEGCQAFQSVLDYGAICEIAFDRDVLGGHADSFATSLRLHLDRTSVREDLIRMPKLEPIEWSENMDFSAISDTGVIGDPTQASADVGAKLWELIIEGGAEATKSWPRAEPAKCASAGTTCPTANDQRTAFFPRLLGE